MTHTMPAGRHAGAGDLTVIVPTYNRYQLLGRLLHYYRACRAPYPMLLLDSSRDAMPAEVQELLRTLPNASHLRYEPSIRPTAKMADGAHQVTTPFAVLWADDDLMVPRAMGKAVEFLQQHQEASVAHGYAGLFEQRPALERAGQGKTLSVGPYTQNSYLDETATQRLAHYFRSGSTIFYSVHRAPNLAGNLARCLEYGLDSQSADGPVVLRSDSWVEIALACLSLIQGQAQRLELLYMLRERHAGMNSWEVGAARVDTFDWFTSNSFSQAYPAFRECLAQPLSEQDGLSLDEARLHIKRVFWRYFGNRLIRFWTQRYATQQPAARQRLRRMLTQVPGARQAWRAMRDSLPGRRFSLQALRHPASPFHRDFAPIYEAIYVAALPEARG